MCFHLSYDEKKDWYIPLSLHNWPQSQNIKVPYHSNWCSIGNHICYINWDLFCGRCNACGVNNDIVWINYCSSQNIYALYSVIIKWIYKCLGEYPSLLTTTWTCLDMDWYNECMQFQAIFSHARHRPCIKPALLGW